MSERTDKQMEIYEFLKKQIQAKGYPPSVREICSAVGLSSTSTVHGHLERLEKKGYIKRDPAKPRAIELLREDRAKEDMINIPVVGNIAAGNPILAIENTEDYFPIPARFFDAKNQLFMLKVQGESMIEAGINDGDLVVIEQTKVAKNGEIVVALIENEATLKTFYKEKNRIRLQPENSSMKPIIVDDCSIVGTLRGLFREY